jgi:TolA-binding protein
MRLKLGLIVIFCAGICFAQDSKENGDFKLAVNLFNDKMYDLALEQFRTFINLYPNSPQGIEARYYLGLTQSKLGRHDEARITFQNFALAYPDNIKAPEAWMNAAEEYVALKNDREAAMAFERVKTFHPKSKFAPAALLNAAEYYNKLGDTENALRVLRTLTEDYTTAEVLTGRIKLAEMLLAAGQFEQARQESKRVIDATNDASLKSRALLLMGQSLLSLGKTSDADKSIADVIKNYRSTPSYYTALFTMAMLKNSSGETDDAMKAWRAIADDSTKAPAQLRQDSYMEMAEANNRVRQFSRALELFSHAGDIPGKRNGEALYDAAVAAERTDNLARAATCYLRAASDTSGRVDERALLIGSFKANRILKNYEEAIRIVDQYRRQFPSDQLLSRLLADGARLALEKLNDPHDAIDFSNYLIERFPTSEFVDDATFLLGGARRTSGDYEGAIAAFEDLQRRYPSSRFVPDAQKQIRLIKAFDQRDRDNSLQKLALLVGDVIAQKSKGNLAYRLAEIYFYNLKDYQLAADQYAYALSVDLEDVLRPKAWFSQAQAYELIALKEGEATEKGKSALIKSIALYDSLAVLFPSSDLADQAVVTAFTQRLQLAKTPEEVRALGSEFLSRSSSPRGKDIALLALGNSYFQSKNDADAALTYKLLLEKYPDRETAQTALFQLGLALDGMMEKDSAAKVLERFLSKNPNYPNSAEAAAYLAKAASDSGQLSKALEYCDVLEKRYYYSPLSVSVDEQRADAYFHAGEYANAASNYLRAFKSSSENYFDVNANPEAERLTVYRLGECAEHLGNLDEAKKWYADYITRDQSTERAGNAYYALASIAKAENNVDRATMYLEEASRVAKKLGGKEMSLDLETGEMLFENERYTDAIARYGDALAKAKSDSLKQYIQSRIVISYYRIDNVKEADKAATAFVKKNPRAYNYAAEFEFERGKYQIRRDDLVKARERFDNTVGSYPKAPIVPEALFWKARVFELERKLPQAVQLFDSILHVYPKNAIVPRVHLSLGNDYYSLEQWDAASKQYRAILDSEQRSPDLVQYAMSNLIMTYKEMELYDGALELTRKYIERFPNDPDLIDKKIDIGIIYQKLGYYDQSILQLQSLIEAGNTSLEAELRYYIGEAYFYKGDYQQAILEFLKVPYLITHKEKADWISTSYYMAGQSYEKMSKYEQAITMYKQIIDRKDTDVQFKTAAQKEIDRVKTVLGKKN